ncbi:hypothetical protein GCM10017781_44390 [Deinococcus metalli]|uniref:DUF4175 domain-containing protein n=1 Tax=Deinococcus metalli TaxID=1141878 RepID=A0ABQ3JXQ6_9DEIO|nr:hypothetical protein GCM10017781_44390 [Deinococcus metalli]
MGFTARRWIFNILFALWCVSVGLACFKLFLPWSGVAVTTGIVFAVAGAMIGLFDREPASPPSAAKPKAP